MRKILLLFFVLLSSLFADIKKDIANCYNIKGELKRLVCYDNIAKNSNLVETTSISEIKNAGKWIVQTKLDPLTDNKNIMLALRSENTPIRNNIPVTLLIRCKNNKTELYISWSDYLGSRSTEVISRIGKEEAITRTWYLSSNNKATFYPTSPISFINEIAFSDKAVFQVTPYNESPVTAIFDTRGLKKALNPLLETCNWKLEKPIKRPVIEVYGNIDEKRKKCINKGGKPSWDMKKDSFVCR